MTDTTAAPAAVVTPEAAFAAAKAESLGTPTTPPPTGVAAPVAVTGAADAGAAADAGVIARCECGNADDGADRESQQGGVQFHSPSPCDVECRFLWSTALQGQVQHDGVGGGIADSRALIDLDDARAAREGARVDAGLPCSGGRRPSPLSR